MPDRSRSRLWQWLRACRRLLVRVERLDRWTGRPDAERPRHLPAGVTIRPASSDDADVLTPLLEGGESAEARFARGDEALVAELDGKPAGCIWLLAGARRTPYYRMPIKPRPGETWVYGGFVAPQARADGLGEALITATHDIAFQRGTIAVGYIDPSNRESVAITTASPAASATSARC